MRRFKALVSSLVVWTVLLSPQLSSALQQVDDYYGQEIRDYLKSPHRDKSFKKRLHKVLASAHIKNNNQPDQIVSQCPSGADCYKHKNSSYNEARKFLLGHLHLEGEANNYYIVDVYCEKRLTKSDFPRGRGPGPGRIPDVQVINTEHTWPQSRFSHSFPKEMQKADLHILFPALSTANSVRGNFPFAEVTPDVRPCPIAARGRALSTYGGTYFEPPDHHKGNVARALFYFSTRYDLSISATEEEYLRAWHKADPVDEFESERNEMIFSYQQVRNPFIDHPWFVDEISDF